MDTLEGLLLAQRSKSRTLLKYIFNKYVLEQTLTDSLSDVAPPFDNAL